MDILFEVQFPMGSLYSGFQSQVWLRNMASLLFVSRKVMGPYALVPECLKLPIGVGFSSVCCENALLQLTKKLLWPVAG